MVAASRKTASGRNRENSFEPVRRILFLYAQLRRTTAGRKLTAQKAHEHMTSAGHEVSLRTVQRYLEMCETFFAGVRRDEGNPMGWWWEENTIDDSLHISKEAALALCLAEAHLKHLIPSAELKHLAPLFQQAKRTIEHGGQVNRYKRMLDRIWIMPRGLQLIPPKISAQIFDDLMRAILDSCEVTIHYRKPSEETSRERIIEPLGLVERSGVYYVVAREKYRSHAKNWALHRISHIKHNSPFAYPRDFNIGDWANSGGLNKQFSPEKIELVLRLSSDAGAHLLESKVGHDQRSCVQSDGCIELRSTVSNTVELRWWLMSLAHECEVVSPDSLRKEIHEMLQSALRNYHKRSERRAG